MSRTSILIVDDEKITAFYLRDLLVGLECDVHLAQNGEEALEILEKQHLDIVITDLVMPGIDGFALVKRIKVKKPDLPVFVLTAHGNPEAARKAKALGADQFLMKPVSVEQLFLAIRKLKEKSVTGGDDVATAARFRVAAIVGTSEPMQKVFHAIEKARISKANVLIRGESGTGKELVARAIAIPGEKESHPFVILNCCAISEGLLESELFGHVRGAFSGAVADREGLFEAADGGSLFLDEIGDMSLHSQTKLLRAIQEGEFRRVGDNQTRHANVRIVAATNRDLEKAVRAGFFREDLYYRLNVIPIRLPPLRSRPSDIAILTRFFLAKHQNKSPYKVELTPEAIELLSRYDFPGNVRELENIIQRTISFASNRTVGPAEVAAHLHSQESAGEDAVGQADLSYPFFKKQLLLLERDYLLSRLKATGGNVADAARAMQITRTALHNRMKKLGLRSKELDSPKPQEA